MNLKKLVERIDITPDENNKSLNTYIQNNIQNKERLDNLLSTLINILESPEKASLNGIDKLYGYIYKGLDGLEYTVSDIDKVANSPIYRTDDTENKRTFGLALSALINKVAKKGDKIQLNISKPMDYLFYLADGIEAHVNTAGNYLGFYAKNSKIYADKAEYYAGARVDNCELHINEAGEQLGFYAKNSKIYVEKSVGWAGHNIDNCELHINEAGDDLGANANNSIIYANETGYNTGVDMKNSKLYIKKLNGDLANSCFRRNNEIYLGKESYKLHPIKYKLKRVDIWETP